MTTTDQLNAVNIDAVAGLAAKIQTEPAVAATVWKASVTWDGGFRSSASVRKVKSPDTPRKPWALRDFTRKW